MARAIALSRSVAAEMQDRVRALIVAFCGCALIAAGQFLPL